VGAPPTQRDRQVGSSIPVEEPEMERRFFGSTGREVPVIGQGTWYGRIANRERTIAALRRGLDLGMSHIDTVEMYAGSEEIVREAIYTSARPRPFATLAAAGVAPSRSSPS
jgi:aryl-alcohol dehydrogenase-like predicted oxidoreductase